jgi:hypothetical protein
LLLLNAPARRIDHARQRRLLISHQHAEANWVERASRNLAALLHGLRLTAEPLTPLLRWYRILSRAMRKYLHGRSRSRPIRCRRRTEPAAAARSRPVHCIGVRNSPAEGLNCSF